MSHAYDDPNFSYGNWNEPHLYLCIRCEGRHQPPVGVIELLDMDGAPSGDFQALCWKHMAIEAAGWVTFLRGPRHVSDFPDDYRDAPPEENFWDDRTTPHWGPQ